MKTTTLAVIAAFGLIAAPAMAQSTWTWAGPKGGTAAGTTDCTNANGVTTCNGNSTYTAPKGKVYQRDSTATGNRYGGTRVITTTGPNGKTATATRSWTRN